MADVDTEDPENVKRLTYCIKTLEKDYAIGGLRIDTVKHVGQNFWLSSAVSSGI